MQNKRIVEIMVGFFILVAIVAMFLLAFKVSGFTDFSANHTIKISAEFDNIGDLRVRAPVKVAGVRIGEVSDIVLDRNSYRALVTMLISGDDKIPTDSSASILSESLLGSNYIAIMPGFDTTFMRNGDKLGETNSAIILENLIGQAIFKPKDEKGEKSNV
ncbi:MAG: outer membrane lipid asymmetry maintenance protein MlaD [Gammaproteobacteria bacterium]|nr:outer membrane lipid asymmetry maintenance protein MlaD [Gammaproteobacteria bacterium]